MDAIEQMLQRAEKGQGGGVSQALLSAPEAERIISDLQPLDITEVGSQRWHTQHEWIEQLNIQAHYNAQTHSDEFVVELLVSLDKLQVLVHDLLVCEAWRSHVYPLLAAHLAAHVDSVTAYLLLYHEAAVANLLQVCLYHSHACEALGEDVVLEVADWCHRKLVRLNAEGAALAEHRERTAEELLTQDAAAEQADKAREVDFAVCMCSLAILRYVTDALPRLPMGALSRVVSTNDTLMALLPLLDRPPWVRTRVPPPPPQQAAKGQGAGAAGGGAARPAARPVLEKWAGNRWAAVAAADRLKMTQTDGQVWLAVTNLLVEPRCRAKYALDEWRRERLLGLKRHLNELMFDQLPVLKDLQRVLDELALGVLPDQGSRGGGLILEAVPQLRERLLRGRDWGAVAADARARHFGEGAKRMARERLEAMVKHLDFLCELEPQPPAAPGAGAAAPAPEPHPPVKVGTWRKVHDSGVYESWYDFAMEVDDSRPPEPVEVAAPPGTSGAGAGGHGAAVHGLRYRLRPLDEESTRPLPANGKAVVRWGSLSAEALLSLPELPTRASGEGAAVLWVTVGLLAVDGLALQIKLKKAAKPKERDRVAGVWYAYHPVAGALTVLRDAQAPPQQQQQRGAAAASSNSGTGGTGGGKAAAGAGSGGGGAGKPLVQVLTPAAAPAKGAAGAAAAPKAAGSEANGQAAGVPPPAAAAKAAEPVSAAPLVVEVAAAAAPAPEPAAEESKAEEAEEASSPAPPSRAGWDEPE